MNTTVLTDWYKKTDFSKEAWLFYIFTAVFFTMPLGTATPTGFAILAAMVWLFSGIAFSSGDIFFKSKWFIPVLIMFLLPWIGLSYSPDFGGLGLRYAKKTHYWIYGLAFSSVLFDKFDARKIVYFFLTGLGINVVCALIQIVFRLPVEYGRYHGLGPGYTTLSTYLIIGMLMAAFLFKQYRTDKKKYWFLALILLYFVHLIFLKSRTGFVTFICISPLILKNIFHQYHPLKVFLIALMIIPVMLLSPVFRERVKLSYDQVNYHLSADENKAWGKEYTVHQDRFYMWRNAFEMFLENPVFGVGTGGFAKTLKARGKPDIPLIKHPHNNILYMAANFGLVGLAAFSWLFVQLLYTGWRYREQLLGYFILVSTMVLLISGMFNTQIINAGTALLLSLTVGFQQGVKE